MTATIGHFSVIKKIVLIVFKHILLEPSFLIFLDQVSSDNMCINDHD